jgi:hypothetical protein
MGREKIHSITREVFRTLEGQVTGILVGPGEMGETVCPGGRVEGVCGTGGRSDTIETARAMVLAGAEMMVIVSGDGTYNDALFGMREEDRVVPIFGIAAGRFNVIYPKRRHDPFVSQREFRPFQVSRIQAEDVMGTVVRVNDKIVGYGFFQTMVANALSYSAPGGEFMLVDAARMLQGEVVPVADFTSTWTDATEVKVVSVSMGEVTVARGGEVSLVMIAQVPDEVNQIMCGGFGAVANILGYTGVVNVFTNPGLNLIPSPEFFPIITKSAGFVEGERVHYSGVQEGSVVQIDSTPICLMGPDDILTVEVVRSLGKKAVPGEGAG